MFDANDPDSFHEAEQFGADILKLCVEVGGCLTGEHGVGVEKRDLMRRAVHRASSSTSSGGSRSAFDPGLAAQPEQGVPARRARAAVARDASMLAPEPTRAGDRRRRSPTPLPRGEPLLIARQRHQAGHAAPGAGGARLSTRNLTGITLYSPKELIISRPRRHAAAGDRGGAGRAGPAPHRRTARFLRPVRTHRGRRRWAAWSPPTSPGRAASPGARCAIT